MVANLGADRPHQQPGEPFHHGDLADVMAGLPVSTPTCLARSSLVGSTSEHQALIAGAP